MEPVFEPLSSEDPREIGGYRILARLGAGGMGRVYLAATQSGRRLALKLVRPEFCDDPEFRRRFRQEVTAAQRVHSLFTAPLVDADPDAPRPWLVTAYVPGPSLAEVIMGHGPLPVPTVRRLMAGVAEALQAIHAAGVIHRDLKPSNVLLAADGPRVIDFGIARAADATPLTRTGFRIGSPHYMAPEQALGQPSAPAIDVFALGSMAYFAATGRAAFGDGPESAVLYRVVHEDPELAGCPPDLLPIIRSCLAKEPEARPSPDEVLTSCAVERDIREWLPSGVTARLPRYEEAPPPPHPPTGPPKGSGGPPPPFGPVPTGVIGPTARTVPGGPGAPWRSAGRVTGSAHPNRGLLLGAGATAISIVLVAVLAVLLQRGPDRPGTGHRPSSAPVSQGASPADTTTVAAGSKPPGSLLGTYRHISLAKNYYLSLTDDPAHPRDNGGDVQNLGSGTLNGSEFAVLKPGKAGSYETCRDDTQYTNFLGDGVRKGELICVTTDTGVIGLIKVTAVEDDPSDYVGLDLTVWQGPAPATENP
jgi:serine/threonine kinase PknH